MCNIYYIHQINGGSNGSENNQLFKTRMVDTFWNNAWHHWFLRILNSLPKIQHLADDTDPLVRFSMLDSLLWQKLSSCSRTNTIVVLYLYQIAQTMSIDVITLYYKKMYIFALAFYVPRKTVYNTYDLGLYAYK